MDLLQKPRQAWPFPLTFFSARVMLALALPLVACGLQWLLWDDFIKPYVWFLFFPAAFFSAWLGGMVSGLSSAVIGALLVWYVFIPPQLSFELKGAASGASMALFVAMGGLYSWFFERLAQAQRRTGEALRATGIANDKITKLYEKTLELDELKSQFFANVSHELRTPLTLIMAPLESRLRQSAGAELPTEARREDEMMLRNAHILYRHVSDLLDAAKLEAGSMTLDYASFDLAELTRTLASHFDSVARERRISYSITVPPSLSIEADSERLQRILLNLLSNAFKFTPDGGEITVRLAAAGQSALIEVQDNGPGVPPALREAVFERFRQLEGTSNRRHSGTGLGLSIVREFTQLHGGAATVTETPGGGALFAVRLPLKAPGGTVLHEQIGALDAMFERQITDELITPAGTNETPATFDAPLVLVVEDNADMSAFIANSLRPRYRVACAGDGRAGLEKARALLPDLIIADVMMPEMSGDAMALAVRQCAELADVPIIMLTAKADDDLRVKLLQAGVQDYLAKPFAVTELLARADGLIRTRRVAGERLRASEDRFESTFEQAAVGIALVAPDGRWLRINRKLCAILGYTTEELLTKAFQDITYPDDLDADLDYVRRMLAKEIDTYSMEKRYFRKDGSVIWANLTVALVWKPGDGPDYFISVVEDISARKAAEQTLHDQDQMLNDMSAMAHIGGWAFDPITGQGSWTPECARIHDLPENTPIDMTGGLVYYTGTHRHNIEAALRAASMDGTPYDLALEMVSATGRNKWIRTIGHPVVENGRVVRIFGAFQEITKSKQVEDELRHRNDELERFNQASEDRELRMIALKREVNRLARELGRAPPHELSVIDDADQRDVP